MNLKGHRKGFVDISFNNTDEKVVTFSKDKTIKLWDVNVRYEVNEDPKCLATVEVSDIPELAEHEELIYRIALFTTEDKRDLMAYCYLNNIEILDIGTKKVIQKIPKAHVDNTKIKKLLFRAHDGNPYLYSLSSDQRINVWKIK
mmetsp:Transcript_39809/g.35535  ORF Transcript_39809/g.35535 Transcript_39809/m.35535 type:complete len:144 (-) Transcript_39809:33-464(-)